MTSAAEQLVHTPPATPPFDIMRAAFVELQVTDLAASEHFYAELLGMIVSARTEDAVYLRGWEERQHHSLILRRGRAGQVPTASRLGFRVRTEDDLDLAAAHFSGEGLTTRWIDAGADPGMGRALRVWDPFGYPLGFFHTIEQFETQHQRFDLHRGAPILRFDHLNLHSPRVEDTFGFWLGLGFRCSEYISTDGDDERITGAWLLRKPTVHDVALTAGTGPRLHHFAYWIADPAGVLRACDQLAGGYQSHVIERGPGRHGVSNAFFVYLRDPDGHRIELYSCDYYTGDPDHTPLRWSVNDPRCRSFWGARAPDSWYDESSLLLGPEGQPVAIEAANVDERAQHSEVAA
ncbi:MAG: 3,4-dihydroxyphenylacetate 2,3-dioxygenase [Solirubrobacteraceae bacterium]